MTACPRAGTTGADCPGTPRRRCTPSASRRNRCDTRQTWLPSAVACLLGARTGTVWPRRLRGAAGYGIAGAGRAGPVTELLGVALDARLMLVALAVGCAGFLRGFVGFGAAMISVPILTLAYGPLVAVPAATIYGLGAALQLLPYAIRHGERPIVAPIAVSILVSAPLGSWLLVSIRPEIMSVAISTLVVVMVAMTATTSSRSSTSSDSTALRPARSRSKRSGGGSREPPP